MNNSIAIEKELNMMEVMQYLEDSITSSKINMNIDGSNCIQS